MATNNFVAFLALIQNAVRYNDFKNNAEQVQQITYKTTKKYEIIIYYTNHYFVFHFLMKYNIIKIKFAIK